MGEIDFERIDSILEKAEKEGRSSLFEHEVYSVLEVAGVKTPATFFIPKDGRGGITLPSFLSGRAVLKIVSPTIVHKTDVAGVAIVEGGEEEIVERARKMIEEVPPRYVAWLREHPELTPAPYRGLSDEELEKRVYADIRGVLVAEFVPYSGKGLEGEFLLGVRTTSEFGPIVAFGVGGVETEFLAERMKPGEAVSVSSALLMGDIPSFIRKPAISLKLLGETRRGKKVVSSEEMERVVSAFAEIARYYSDYEERSPFVITELEVNPLVANEGRLVPLDGLLKFRRRREKPIPRPTDKVGKLLIPESIAIIGVSGKEMNMGRIILRNIIGMGFPKERLYILKKGVSEIDGCRAFPDVSSLPEKVDTLIVAISADQVPSLIRETVEEEKAESIIIIPAGMAEKKGGESREEEIKKLLAERRSQGKDAPVINGGNCLGIHSVPGRYDTLFIPERKWERVPVFARNIAYISQSGAFMISRMTKLPRLEPRYGISVGNQVDLTISDYLAYLKDDPEIAVYGVYIEGFKEGDGIAFARISREILAAGRDVIAYKAGRTAEGRDATSGHTASIAGDYYVFEAVARDAGVLVARDFAEFEGLTKLASYFAEMGKKIKGDRVAAVSNAGFECVGFADNIRGEDYELRLAKFSPETEKRIASAFSLRKIDAIIDIHNPLDLTPMATDEVVAECIRALIEDDGVHSIILSLVPLTAALNTLPPSPEYEESIEREESVVKRVIALNKETEKPLIAVVDCGGRYDPMVSALEAGGIPVFRTADYAMRLLGYYTFYRLALERI